jgi:hypothetical protein
MNEGQFKAALVRALIDRSIDNPFPNKEEKEGLEGYKELWDKHRGGMNEIDNEVMEDLESLAKRYETEESSMQLVDGVFKEFESEKEQERPLWTKYRVVTKEADMTIQMVDRKQSKPPWYFIQGDFLNYSAVVEVVKKAMQLFD